LARRRGSSSHLEHPVGRLGHVGGHARRLVEGRPHRQPDTGLDLVGGDLGHHHQAHVAAGAVAADHQQQGHGTADRDVAVAQAGVQEGPVVAVDGAAHANCEALLSVVDPGLDPGVGLGGGVAEVAGSM